MAITYSGKVLANVTTGTSRELAAVGDVEMVVEWNASAHTAGAVTLEAAGDVAYGGTWKAIGTLSFGNNLADRLQAAGPFARVRARVSTAIAGGASPGADVFLTAWE